MAKKKIPNDLSWVTDVAVDRMNHIRHRANLPEFSKDQWLESLKTYQPKEIWAIRSYIGI